MNKFLIKNKYTTSIFAFILIFSLWVLPTSASTFFTDSSVVNVKKGDIVTIKVFTNSDNIRNYTFKSSIEFSSDVLTATDWKWADGWMAVNQEGYDKLDNSLGSIIKTAGYPGGLTDIKEFGTITFVAEKDGQATISFDEGESFILNADSENTYKK